MTDSPRDEGVRPPAAHKPVLLREVLRALTLKPGLTVLDGTVGAAGHSQRILAEIGPTGMLVGFDRDPMMLDHARRTLSETGLQNFQLQHASYSEMEEILRILNIDNVDRILLDLGYSSDQLNDKQRGFGIDTGGPLDLRFDTSRGIPAWKFLEQQTEQELANIIHQYGEERHSRNIAAKLTQQTGIHTVADLTEAIEELAPRSIRPEDRKKTVIRVFQALRIAVNNELDHLQSVLNNTLNHILNEGGIAAIISFHSLEDRLVKTAFRDKKQWEILTPKPIVATSAEKKINPRCRMAKLRVARKL